MTNWEMTDKAELKGYRSPDDVMNEEVYGISIIGNQIRKANEWKVFRERPIP